MIGDPPCRDWPMLGAVPDENCGPWLILLHRRAIGWLRSADLRLHAAAVRLIDEILCAAALSNLGEEDQAAWAVEAAENVVRAEAWRRARRDAPGSTLHRYRRRIVGLFQIALEWRFTPDETIREAGRRLYIEAATAEAFAKLDLPLCVEECLGHAKSLVWRATEGGGR